MSETSFFFAFIVDLRHENSASEIEHYPLAGCCPNSYNKYHDYSAKSIIWQRACSNEKNDTWGTPHMSTKWRRGPTNCEYGTGLWEYVSTEQSVIDFWRPYHNMIFWASRTPRRSCRAAHGAKHLFKCAAAIRRRLLLSDAYFVSHVWDKFHFLHS